MSLSRRKLFSILAILLIALSWWQMLAARSGLMIRDLVQAGVPMRYMVRDQAQRVPGVLVAHGFGVSQQIMRAFGYSLAHAGYGVMLWDFDGHGANDSPFGRDADSLRRNLEAAHAGLVAQPEIDASRIALLGHSMGSGAVMQAAIRDPGRYQATIAVSPTGAAVTAEVPRNLLLQAGAWEGRFVTNAQELLIAAGGENQDFASGRARSLLVVPNAEHILILFSHAAHQSAVAWLDAAFGLASTSTYRDTRSTWFLVSLAGWMMLITALAPLLTDGTRSTSGRLRPPWPRWGLLAFPFLASLALAALNQIFPVNQLGGIMVGGAAALWFFIMGLGWLWSAARPPRLSWRHLAQGVGLFLFLQLAVGVVTHMLALNWLLTPSRLLRWPFMAAAYLPWLLVTGQLLQGASWRQRAGWWLAQSLFICAGLIAAVALIPALSVLILALPLVPLILAIMIIAGAAAPHPWSYAIGSAMFFAWLLMAYFPLAS